MKQGVKLYLLMTGINQLPCLLHFLLESDNGCLILLTESESCLHLGSIAHNLPIQLFHLFGQACFVVYTA